MLVFRSNAYHRKTLSELPKNLMAPCCHQMTTQQRHVAMSKVILLLCTLFLVHHCHKEHHFGKHHGPSEQERPMMTEMDAGMMKNKKKSESYSLSLLCSPSHSKPEPKLDAESAGVETDVAVLTDNEGDELIVEQQRPIPNMHRPDDHHKPKGLCLMTLMGRLALFMGIVAGFCARSKTIRVWMGTLILSAIVHVSIISIRAVKDVDCGGFNKMPCKEYGHKVLAHLGFSVLAHLVFIVLAWRFLRLARAVETDVYNVIVAVPVSEEECIEVPAKEAA